MKSKKEYNAEWYQKNKERLKAKNKENYKNNKEAYKYRSIEWRKENREKRLSSQRKTNLKLKYNLKWEDYLSLYNEQQGCCAICGTFLELYDNNKAKVPHVDHCHSTGQVRGLLCTKCNLGIGYFNDNQTSLSNALVYLKKWHF